ncbi:MAG: DNA-3-methyladenine glycosylase [Acidimicrobiales bacterium]
MSASPDGVPLPASWFERDSWETAPDLLNKVIAVRSERRWRWARLVEVEAYAWFDPASHSYPGPTARNAVMFGPPGHLYVYFSYGMHWCANVVTGPLGSGQAVLLRAGSPLGGVAAMTAARGRATDLCNGPARLAQALGLTGTDSGMALARAGRGRCVVVLDDAVPPPASPGVGPRVGITKGVEVPWRWWVPGAPAVSRPRRLTGTEGSI